MKNQGKFGSEADLDFTTEKASTLEKSDGFKDFKLPDNHNSVVIKPDGTIVKATHVRVKNNGETWHGYPIIK